MPHPANPRTAESLAPACPLRDAKPTRRLPSLCYRSEEIHDESAERHFASHLATRYARRTWRRPRHVVMATSALRQRLAVRWTLTSLAEEVHLSRSQLVRAFDATVGRCPMAYLRHTRVDQRRRATHGPVACRP